MLKLFVFCFLTAYGACGAFFDLTDIDDPLSMLWNTKQSLLVKKQMECKVQTSIGSKYGVCLHPSHCLLSGGAPNGHCGFLSTCCTYERSCGKSSKAKVSYFEGGGSGVPTSCEYQVELNNANVCQIRLDFNTFILAPATLTDSDTKYTCNNDRLVIKPNHYGIPELCGTNTDQHVYVHVNQTRGTKFVTLNIILADRNTNLLVTPYWKIKVTQLECPERVHNQGYQDFKHLAPLGSVQYFDEYSGSLKSFGFDGLQNTNSYTAGELYAISFKRHPDVCGVKFSPVYIYLGIKTVLNAYTDSDCLDYLFVPNLEFEEDQATTKHDLVAKVCLKQNEVFKSTPPGPLHVYFSSIDQLVMGTEPLGFNIKYELLTKC